MNQPLLHIQAAQTEWHGSDLTSEERILRPVIEPYLAQLRAMEAALSEYVTLNDAHLIDKNQEPHGQMRHTIGHALTYATSINGAKNPSGIVVMLDGLLDTRLSMEDRVPEENMRPSARAARYAAQHGRPGAGGKYAPLCHHP